MVTIGTFELLLNNNEQKYCEQYNRKIKIETYKILYIKSVYDKDDNLLYSSIIDSDRKNWIKE